MSKLKPRRSLTGAEFNKTMSTLEKESDRSAVIIVSAWLNDVLENYIQIIFRYDKVILSSLFDSEGILGSFSSKIKVAYLLGLFERTVFNDLNAIRKIRNDCAHFRENFSFRIKTAKAVCNSLETIHVFNQFFITPVRSAREKFLTAALILVHYLMDMKKGLKKLELPPKSNGQLDYRGIYVKGLAKAISIEIIEKQQANKIIHMRKG